MIYYKSELHEEIKELSIFISEKVRSINNNSSEAERTLKSVLITMLINLYAAIFLIEGRIEISVSNKSSALENSGKVFEEYLAYIKRSFIIDIWSVFESRIRIVVKEMKCPERNAKIFPSMRDAVLKKLFKDNTEAVEKWKVFFNTLANKRHSQHSGFKSKGKAITLSCSQIKEIIESVMEFFNLLEGYMKQVACET